MILAMLFGTVLVILTVLIHYEILRFTAALLPKLRMPPRQRTLVVIFAAFGAHTLEVWLHAGLYYLLTGFFGLGTIVGDFDHSLRDYLYFSTATYTTLGIGDVYPLGDIRIVAGVQAVLGLMMIGWSASFTYLAMQSFWGEHRK